MVLNEVLRNQIDAVSRRQRVSEHLAAFSRGLFAALITFLCIRVLLGLLTGGQGGFIALVAAVASGFTFIITAPHQQHNRLTAARYIDQQLNLHDRLATAVEHATLDHAARNRVEEWLFKDAANHTQLIDPAALVPLKAPAYTRWLLPLLGLSILITLIPYPQGLSWQFADSGLQQVSQRAEELIALADQFERMDAQNPHLQQLADELRRVSELIRDKQLPQSQANQLLRQLEQELQQNTNNASSTSLGLDLDRVQELTQSIRNIEGGRYAQLSPQEQAALSQAQRKAGDPGTDGRGELGSSDNIQGTGDAGINRPGTPGAEEQGSGSASDRRQSHTSAQSGTDATGEGEEDFDPFAGSGFGSEGFLGDGEDQMDYESGGGNMAGDQRGNQGTTDYERQSNRNQGAERIAGQITDSGQYHSSATSSTSIPDNNRSSPTVGGSSYSLPGGVENAIQQENIPLAYQRWIRDYFIKIDPSSNQ